MIVYLYWKLICKGETGNQKYTLKRERRPKRDKTRQTSNAKPWNTPREREREREKK